jgi:hypothetical protein
MKYALLRALTFLSDIPGWLIVLFLRAAWGATLRIQDHCLVVYLDEDGWPARTWYKKWAGTAIGHAIIINPNARDLESTLYHEGRHVEQYEGFALVGILVATALAVLGHPLAAVASAASLSYACMFFAMIAAWLRGEDMYRGSAMEEGAYDAQALRDQEKKS